MTNEEKKLKDHLLAALEAATVRNPDGQVRGYRAIGPAGQLVLLRPGSIQLAIDLARGFHLVGLKEGWSLASEADEKKRAAENKKAG